MARPSSKSFLVSVLILCAAVGLWIFDAYDKGKLGSLPDSPHDSPATAEHHTKDGASTSKHTGEYETYRNCTLAADRSNDGDSFRVLFPDGRKEIVRLYFVDAPESAFRTYRGGENNHRRISEQARALGGISPEQAVGIGKQAKEFTLQLLAENPFTIHTEWESPFHDERYHAFVELSYGGNTRFLHELLIEKGYARIYTRGAQLPNGTSVKTQKQRLYQLERSAKSKQAGAWAQNPNQ